MLDRKTPPAFSKEFSFDLPKPEISEVRSGLPLVWIKDIQQEVIKLELVFRAGKWHEPKKGVSYFTGHMLEKGTAKLDSEKIAEWLDQQGAQLEVSSGADFTSISLYSLLKNFEKVLPLFIQLLTEPSFPESELNLLSSIFLEKLKVNNEKNNFVASKILNKNIFGETHPYGKSSEESDIRSLGTSDLKNFYRDTFSPFEIYLTGNLSQQKLSSLKKELANLPNRANPFVDIQEIEQAPTKEIIQKEQSVQSSIKFGKKTIKKNHPDHAGLLLLNHILGGYFGSRLMKNIREEKGLTYGIYSSFHSFLHEGLFTIATDTNKENVELTAKEIVKEIQALMDSPIPKEELEIAKNHFLGNLQLEISNPFSVIEKIKHIRLHNLSEHYFQDLYKTINSTSSKELQRIATHWLDPATLHFASVG
jgi:zinc protease